MNAREIIRRIPIIGPLVARATEGAFRPGPYYLPVTGGWLPDGAALNWWQLGYNPIGDGSRSAIVEACVSAYAQTIAMCPGDHWRLNDKKGRTRVTTSALSRLLRHPNAYQSISDFLLNLTRYLFLDGNAYALALRNDRFEVTELHLMDSRLSRPQLAVNGEVFYQLGGNQVIEKQITGPLMVPQRDVLHVRLHCPRGLYPWPLVGMSPLEAALPEIAVGDAMLQQQVQFYLNQARPSAVLSTDLVLDKDQVQALRDRWNEQVRGLGAGGTPILTAGLKVQPWGLPPKDAMIADMAKLSDQRIALVFRVPLQILGIGGTPYASTELLMQSWIASGLGFALNHIEEAFGVLFQLKGQPDEYVEFDTAALLRSALKDRIDALARGVQGGIYSPNDARNSEGLDSVSYGDEPRVQQQVVPLSAAAGIPAPPAPGPQAPPSAETIDAAPKDYSDDVKREVRNLIAAAERAARRFS
jgi:HK97 family phage portal protein